MIRAEAPDTLAYFESQGVDLKVISGDDPVTVSAIARRAGLKNAEQYVDATTITTQEQMDEAVADIQCVRTCDTAAEAGDGEVFAGTEAYGCNDR